MQNQRTWKNIWNIFLQKEGFSINNNNFTVRVKAFICDRPARSFLKSIKNHGGYFACERCTVEGKRVENRMVYPDMDCALKTHKSFSDKENVEHHTGDSPLLRIPNIDVVNMFVLDSMHLFFLGVMKKLLIDF